MVQKCKYGRVKGPPRRCAKAPKHAWGTNKDPVIVTQKKTNGFRMIFSKDKGREREIIGENISDKTAKELIKKLKLKKKY